MLTPVADPLERSLPAPLLVSLLTGVVQRGHTFRFRAGGGSMFPFIRDGDILSIVPLSADRPARLGDVLAFDRGGGDYAHLVVHRLVGRTASGYLLRGDAHAPGHSDGCLPPNVLLGRVAGVEREGRPVRLGLGSERLLIALLSRVGLLWLLVRAAVFVYRLRPRKHD
jgi:signal peptidase I